MTETPPSLLVAPALEGLEHPARLAPCLNVAPSSSRWSARVDVKSSMTRQASLSLRPIGAFGAGPDHSNPGRSDEVAKRQLAGSSRASASRGAVGPLGVGCCPLLRSPLRPRVSRCAGDERGFATLTPVMLSCERRVTRESGGGGHAQSCGQRRQQREGHERNRVPSDAARRSLAVDRGLTTSARIRAPASSTRPPFLAASIVLKQAKSEPRAVLSKPRPAAFQRRAAR
jgi:hypothetical protein